MVVSVVPVAEGLTGLTHRGAREGSMSGIYLARVKRAPLPFASHCCGRTVTQFILRQNLTDMEHLVRGTGTGEAGVLPALPAAGANAPASSV